MANSCEIRLNKAINFKEHKQLCRLCLSKFKNERNKVKITRIIEDQYFLLTMFNLIPSQKFSQTICSQCIHFLNEFTIQRNDWIFKQSQLEKHVEKEDGANEGEINVKQEIIDNPQENLIVKIESDDDTEVFESFNGGNNEISSDEYETFPKPSKVGEPSSSSTQNPSKLAERSKRKPPSAVEDASSDDDFQSNPRSPESFTSHEKSSSKKRHWKAEMSLRVHECDHCSSSFKHKHMLDTHILKKHPATLTEAEMEIIKKKRKTDGHDVVCPECGKLMKSISLRTHIRRRHRMNRQEELKNLQQKTERNEKNVSKTWENETSPELSKVSRWQREQLLRIHHCGHCNSSFQHSHMLDNHRLKMHPKTVPDEEAKRILTRQRLGAMKICQECGATMPSVQMNTHMVLHRAKNYSCDVCGYKTQKHSHIRAHVIKHIKVREKAFECNQCEKKYSRLNGLKAHIRQFHAEVGKIYKCEIPECGKEFDQYWRYHKHRSYECAKDTIMQCPHCNKEVTKRGIIAHSRVDFEDRFKTFECTDCVRTFPNKRCLNHHQMLHKGEIYYCDYPRCTRCFNSQASLNRHQEMHQSIKNYHCPHAGCDKTFAKSQSLKNHIAVKHENYRKKCPVESCIFQAGISQSMKHHLIQVHTELSENQKEMYLAHVRNLKLL